MAIHRYLSLHYLAHLSTLLFQLSHENAPTLNYRMTKKENLFDSVVLIKDGSEDGFEEEFGKTGEGWKAAFFAILRPVMRDVKVYKTGSEVSKVKMVVEVYRDCGRIYFGSYDPVTTMQRYCSITEYQVHLLLAPNTVEAKLNTLPPANPEEMYARLVELLRVERDRFTRRQELVIKRHLRRLHRTGLRIGSTYSTVTMSECAPGEVVIHVYDPTLQHTHEIYLSEESISQLAEDSVLSEREAYLSQITERMVPFLLDRLRFRANILKVRRRGGGGRLIYQQGRNITNIYSIVTLSTFEGAVKIRVYNPHTSIEYVYNLSVRESLDLLGSLNPGNIVVLVHNMNKRLSYKKGSCILDRVLLRDVVKVSTRYLILEILCPVTRDIGGVDVKAYASNASELWSITLSDQDIKTLTGFNLVKTTSPTARRLIYRRLFEKMTLMHSKMEETIPGQRITSIINLNIVDENNDLKPILSFPSFTRTKKLGKLIDPEDIPIPVTIQTFAANQLPPPTITATDDSNTIVRKERKLKQVEVKPVESGENALRVVPGTVIAPSGDTIYRNIMSLGGSLYMVSMIWLSEIKSIFVQAYNPLACQSTSVHLSHDELKRIAGSKVELLGDKDETRKSLAEYIAAERLSIQEGAPLGRTVGTHVMEGNFSLVFEADRLYFGPHKITKVQLFNESDVEHQVIPGAFIRDVESRGKKIYIGGQKISGDYHVVTIFEMSDGENLRFIATNPTTDSTLHLQLTSLEVQKAVAAVPPFRSETYFQHLYYNDTAAAAGAEPSKKVDSGKQVKDPSNPRWLLRRNQRKALCLVLNNMLRIRKPLNKPQQLILDSSDAATVAETERIREERLRAAAGRVTILKECFSLLGGYAMVKCHEQQESKGPCHLGISVYVPKYRLGGVVDVPEFVSSALLEPSGSLSRDVGLLRAICRTIEIIISDSDEGMKLTTRMNIDFKIMPPAELNGGSEGEIVVPTKPIQGIQLLQRGGVPILKRTEGNEILSEGMHLCGYYVLVRAFYDDSALRIIIYDPFRSQSDTIVFSQESLMGIFGGHLDAWFSRSRAHSTALNLVSWIKLKDVEVVNHIVVELDRDGFIASEFTRRKANDGQGILLEKDSESVKESGKKLMDADRQSIINSRVKGKAAYASIVNKALYPDDNNDKRPKPVDFKFTPRDDEEEEGVKPGDTAAVTAISVVEGNNDSDGEGVGENEGKDGHGNGNGENGGSTKDTARVEEGGNDNTAVTVAYGGPVVDTGDSNVGNEVSPAVGEVNGSTSTKGDEGGKATEEVTMQ
jgi:hypothetical protein